MFFIVIIRIEQFCGAKLRFLFELCKKMQKNRPERRFFSVRCKGGKENKRGVSRACLG
jgi:hypothetical protein